MDQTFTPNDQPGQTAVKYFLDNGISPGAAGGAQPTQQAGDAGKTAGTDPQGALTDLVAGVAKDAPAAASAASGPDPYAGLPDWLASVYRKDNYKLGGQGSGFGDSAYWANDAVKNSNGDTVYLADRLDKDIRGVGQDKAGPGDYGDALKSGASGGGGPQAPSAPQTSSLAGSLPGSLVPMTSDTTSALQAAVQKLLGQSPNGDFDQQALLAQMRG
jgi:hypothetical protein